MSCVDFLLLAWLLLLCISTARSSNNIVVVTGDKTNDLCNIIQDTYPNVTITQDIDRAIFDADNSASIFVLADGYPKNQVDLQDYHIMLVGKKGLSLFVEFPTKIPGSPQLKPQKLMTTV
jgi:hypothetical protein